MAKEITVQELNAKDFIHEKVEEIQSIVKDGMAINALSGGVDSSTVTMLGHRALGSRLRLSMQKMNSFLSTRRRHGSGRET